MVGVLSWILVIVLAGAAMLGTLLSIDYLLIKYRPTWSAKHSKRIGGVGLTVWCVVVGVATLSPAYYEFPDWPNTLYSVQNGKLVKKPWGTFQWGKELAWVPSPKDVQPVMGGITQITSNPKVRRINYQVNGRIVDAQKYLAAPERRRTWINETENTSVWGDVKLLLNYELYEFNNSHSSELAEFYNPLDPAQQARFRKLVEGWFNERLGPKGLLVTADNFQLPYFNH